MRIVLVVMAAWGAGSSGAEPLHAIAKATMPAAAPKSCRTCTYYEGYVALPHGNRESLPPKMKAPAPAAAKSCGDGDRGSYCGTLTAAGTCDEDSWCYWDDRPRCEPIAAPRSREAAPRCRLLAKEGDCTSTAGCAWVKDDRPCKPKLEILSCNGVNAKPGIDKASCCASIDGCSWGANGCGPWRTTLASCALWKGLDKTASYVTGPNREYPKGRYVTPTEWSAKQVAAPLLESTWYLSNMRDQCKTLHHLNDGHGRWPKQMAEEVVKILDSQKSIETIHVEDWGCQTFDSANPASPHAKAGAALTKQAAAEVASSLLALAPIGKSAVSLSADTAPKLAVLDDATASLARHLVEDARVVFEKNVAPRWQEIHRKTGKRIAVTMYANQLNASACSCSEDSRASTTPFGLGIHDGKLVQWPGFCSAAVSCTEPRATGVTAEPNEYLCRLPERADADARLELPDFDNPKAAKNGLVVRRRCAWNEKQGAFWETAEELPHFPYVLRDLTK